VLEPELLAFVRTSIPSMWALELLLLLRRATPEALSPDELVARLRATPTLIERLLEHFSNAGLVMRDETGAAWFECATPDLEKLCADLASAAAERPVALREAIVSSPSDKLRSFADAFRLKGSDPTRDGGKDE
jgi:hypothetical protein